MKFRTLITFVFVSLFSFSFAASSSISANSFSNPIADNYDPVTNTFHGGEKADPYVMYLNGYYYGVQSCGQNAVRMYKSANLFNLFYEQNGTTIVCAGAPCYNAMSSSTHFFAPRFYWLDNGSGTYRWYLYFSASGNGNPMAAVINCYQGGSDPLNPLAGAYEWVGNIDNSGLNIDPDIQSINGELYMFASIAWSGGGQCIGGVRLSNPWTAYNNSSFYQNIISVPEYGWETVNYACNEAPMTIWHEGELMLFYAASGACYTTYSIGQLTWNGGNPLLSASWEKNSEPVFVSSPENSVYGPASNGLFLSPDGTQYWNVYSAKVGPIEGNWDRTIRAQQYSWTSNKVADFGIPVALGAPISEPSAGNGGSTGTIYADRPYFSLGQWDESGHRSYTRDPNAYRLYELKVPSSGLYSFTIDAIWDKDHEITAPTKIIVNGSLANSTATYNPSFMEKTYQFNVNLNAGVNTVMVKATGSCTDFSSLSWSEVKDPVVINPGFESGIAGWYNDSSAGYTETVFPYSGSYNLAHYSLYAYTNATYQKVSVKAGVSYTLSAYVWSSGGQNSCLMYVKNPSFGFNQVVDLTGYKGSYKKVNLSFTVPTGCNNVEIGFWSDSPGDKFLRVDEVSLKQN